MSITGVIILVVGVFGFLLGFLLLVFALIPTIQQLRSTLLDIEKTSAEIRDLSHQVKRIGVSVEDKLAGVEEILNTSKRAVGDVGNALNFLRHDFVKKASGLVALLPAIKWGWNLVRQFKRRNKHE